MASSSKDSDGSIATGFGAVSATNETAAVTSEPDIFGNGFAVGLKTAAFADNGLAKDGLFAALSDGVTAKSGTFESLAISAIPDTAAASTSPDARAQLIPDQFIAGARSICPHPTDDVASVKPTATAGELVTPLTLADTAASQILDTQGPTSPGATLTADTDKPDQQGSLIECRRRYDDLAPPKPAAVSDGLLAPLAPAAPVAMTLLQNPDTLMSFGTLLGDPQTAMDWLNIHYPLMPALQGTHFELPLLPGAASFNPAWIAETASASLLIPDSASGYVI